MLGHNHQSEYNSVDMPVKFDNEAEDYFARFFVHSFMRRSFEHYIRGFGRIHAVLQNPQQTYDLLLQAAGWLLLKYPSKRERTFLRTLFACLRADIFS